MRKTTLTELSLLSALLLLLLAGSLSFAGESPLKAFPPAAEGEVRHIITLEEKSRAEEVHYKVELIPGKVTETDGVNRVRIGFAIESETLQGWGYTYYKVIGKGELMSTMMAQPEEAEPVERFVGGNSLFIRYNSRLPVVVYGPEGVDIHYRIWVAGKEMIAEKE